MSWRQISTASVLIPISICRGVLVTHGASKRICSDEEKFRMRAEELVGWMVEKAIGKSLLGSR